MVEKKLAEILELTDYDSCKHLYSDILSKLELKVENKTDLINTSLFNNVLFHDSKKDNIHNNCSVNIMKYMVY